MSKATVTNPAVGDSRGKPRVIPGDVATRHRAVIKEFRRKDLSSRDGPLWY